MTCFPPCSFINSTTTTITTTIATTATAAVDATTTGLSLLSLCYCLKRNRESRLTFSNSDNDTRHCCKWKQTQAEPVVVVVSNLCCFSSHPAIQPACRPFIVSMSERAKYLRLSHMILLLLLFPPFRSFLHQIRSALSLSPPRPRGR